MPPLLNLFCFGQVLTISLSFIVPILVRYDLNQIPYDYSVEVRHRFNTLDLIDRVPEDLWMEVRDIVQETGIKTIPKKKKCKKAKWLSEEALQNSCEKQRRKGKIKASECRVPEKSKER